MPEISGYRVLTDHEIAHINDIKDVGLQLKAMIAVLRTHPGVETKWVNIAETQLQQGMMSAVRAIAKPGGF